MAPEAELKGLKILVVDDEPGERETVCSWLREEGCEVSQAGTGDEALSGLGKGAEIVMAPLRMPGLDAGDLAKRARSTGNADVLILARKRELEGAIRAIRDGAFDYIVKPPNRENLLSAVRRCADMRHQNPAPPKPPVPEPVVEKAAPPAAAAAPAAPPAEGPAAAQAAQMEKVREIFGNFITPEVAQFILAHPLDFWRQEEQKQVSVLFADVRGFTPFARVVSPREAVSSLNEIFERAIDAVHSEKGIVSKFLGDGMMAVFGAPVPLEDHAGAAVRAALRLRRYIDELVRARRSMGRVPLRIGIGINSGEVIVCCLGSRARAEYNVIGHSVNLAARLEDEAAAGTILIGPQTAEAVKARFELRERGYLDLQGMLEPILVHELVCEL